MVQGDSCIDKTILRKQQDHWENVFSNNNAKFGEKPSLPAQWAAETFRKEGKAKILELGAGQGRDTLFFAGNGFEVYSLDYSKKGIQVIEQKARENGLSEHITTLQYDVRKPLPFEDETFDACYSHMLYCMPLTISELESVSKEIKRVLKPGGLNIFTTRHTGDSQYRLGIHRCEDMWEIEGGFIVHFLSKEKIEHLSEGYDIIDIKEFDEGPLPRKLFMVSLRKS
ncbi:class I SAM-dependent methyltransferase [Methanolobus mangrovi]|uniref:Class I SAM-dependent methyltransferase n=1 Tax=Methanolobus mangrovi TaxID=3072977 RepID=A0AA51YHC9_9EURY|nr:class I SAM-dependent methyltransferase [Methanolobus mangrovi]WMW23027.1 class I SAM-dependent methyltransferase [Methanolobus mangrovi]